MTGFTSNVTYTAFDGSKWNMRVYEGAHVSLLIPDSWFSNFPTTINSSYGVGPFPGLRADLLSFLVGQLDKGYEFYVSLTGHEPANNPGAPNNLLRIAFLPELGAAAGLGLIGMKGVEIGGAYLEKSMYAALQGEVQQTIFWHELGRNFSVGFNDVGVKYVLTDYMSMPTFMGWEYGEAYEQFVLDQNYLLPRYYLADNEAGINAILTPPYKKPNIDSALSSKSLSVFFNGGDIRPGIAYQYYLEQGFDAYKAFAGYLLNNSSSNPGQFVADIVTVANNNPLGLDYSYLLKNGSWQINNLISGGPKNVQLQQAYGKMGVYQLFGAESDTIKITSSGQFRLDGGDGYDQVTLPIAYDTNINISIDDWITVVTSEENNLRVVLNFFEKISFSDGKSIDVSVPYNSLFPFVEQISNTLYKTGYEAFNSIKISFSEPINLNADPTWGGRIYGFQQAPYVDIKTKNGEYINSYRFGGVDTVVDGSDVYILLPSLTKQQDYDLFFHGNVQDSFGNTANYNIFPDKYSFKFNGEIDYTKSNYLTYGNNSYLFIRSIVTYDEALKLAEKYTYKGVQGHLLTIENETENNFVSNMLGVNDWSWLAVSDKNYEGRWVYTSGPDIGKPIVYSDWGDGEPNTLADSDFGIILNPSSSPWWMAHDPTRLIGYIVEFEGANSNSYITNNRDWIQGTYSSDKFENSRVNEFFSGLLGTDEVVYSGVRSNYIIHSSVIEDPHNNLGLVPLVNVRWNSSSGDDDNLMSIERVRFNDGSLIYDVPNNSDNSLIYRLYQAAFARTPDEEGFRYWVDQHNNSNLNFDSMASLFIASAEFKTKYGASPSNAQLVELLYQNVLGREPDAAGLKFWQDSLNSNSINRDYALINFANSAENVKLTEHNLDNGYWLI